MEGLLLPILFGLAVAAVIAAMQVPAAYSSAKSYCKEEWVNSGGSDFSTETPIAYRLTKCDSVWPDGPD